MDVVLPKPGRYVVAVSGGVDSVVLLDILARQEGLELTVAHFDHGIREDSSEDRQFVEELATRYKVPFMFNECDLGPKASEDKARQARYAFLRQAQKDSESLAIITAHHQDDLLETAILNMLRGTGRKGLTSLQSRAGITRPLLNVPKKALLLYAQKNGLSWREDPSNQDLTYLRNYVRHKLLQRFSDKDRTRLLELLTNQKNINSEIDVALEKMLKDHDEAIARQWFNQLPHAVAKELMATWLRANGTRDFDSKTLERLVTAAKTATAGKKFPVLQGVNMHVQEDYLALALGER